MSFLWLIRRGNVDRTLFKQCYKFFFFIDSSRVVYTQLRLELWLDNDR